MMNLAEYRRSISHLADFLPWAALVDEGIVLNKDGSFQRTARFRGPDLDSATPAELVGVAGRLNNALRRLGSGWADLCRGAAAPRQPISRKAISRMRPQPWSTSSAARNSRRRARISRASYFLTFLWLPPAEDAARAEGVSLRGTRSPARRGCSRKCTWIRRPYRPRAWACRGLYARTRMAR